VEQVIRTRGLTKDYGSVLALDPDPELDLDVHDLIRDTAFDLGVGLVRIQADHRRIEDVFADA
jgi:ABC-2 type transport system ATP-binding protein